MDKIEQYLDENNAILTMDLMIYRTKAVSMPRNIEDAINFLKGRFSFIYQPNLYQPCPFSPMMVFEEKRSIQPSDLSEENIDTALSLLDLTESHALRAKILDVVGFLRKDKELKLQAAEEYYKNFSELVNCGKTHEFIPPLQRCLYLLSQNGKKQNMKSIVIDLLEQKDYSDEVEFSLVFYLSEFIPKFAPSLMPRGISAANTTIDKHLDEPISLDIIDNLFPHIKDTNEKEKWKLRYADIAKKVANRTSPHGYHYLERAASYFSEASTQFSELKFLSEEEQKKLYSSLDMKSLTFELDNDLSNGAESYRKMMIETMQALPDGTMQFLVFLKYFKPYEVANIENEYQKQKNSIRYLVNNISFNDDGTIGYESAVATDEDKKERIISDIYNLHTVVSCPLTLWPFIDNLKIDQEFTDFMSDLLSHNLFVPNDRYAVVFEKILSGLRKNISDALYYLIPQLEYGFLSYIKDRKHIYPNHNGNTININNMLVQKGNSQNRFRNALLEVLDPSLVQQLEYRLCRKFGGNFRNRSFHSGLSSTTQFSVQEAEAFFLILLVYCQGYDPEI